MVKKEDAQLTRLRRFASLTAATQAGTAIQVQHKVKCTGILKAYKISKTL